MITIGDDHDDANVRFPMAALNFPMTIKPRSDP
ncbi:hypothetical protein FOMA001_g650 [Fusarium oxysporum f. sp. matthiolae]|nr:hypothetical protein FOMA001_g650 [Fusarium oxysporum f. sp. matthiolae]